MGNSQGRPVVFTDNVNLDHFKLLRVVGKGAFGKVRIVERKDTGLTFALKYIRKDEVVRQENVRNIIRERKMLEHLNHPFLCNLRYSFQDFEYLYLVVDLMNGGDLRFHITRKTFEERAIRFWIAQLGCALRYVHEQGIVHRDVKPDNVLLDSEGHVHLADFNVAADYTNPRKPLTSKSGTLAYLAPEAYEGGPYRSEVDWWGLGVVFYECIYGKRPFEARHSDELGKKIKAANPRFPRTEPPVDTTCETAIRRLLSRNIHDRIGANGFDNFTAHPFFLDIDFAELERKRIPPVFVPSSDKTNFDATYDLEELLLEEAPLEARARHQKPRPKLKADASTSEKRAATLHEMIETYFEPFDYTSASFDKLAETNEESTASSASVISPEVSSAADILTDDQRQRDVYQTPSSQPQSRSGSPPLTSQVSGHVLSGTTSNTQQLASQQEPKSGSPDSALPEPRMAPQRTKSVSTLHPEVAAASLSGDTAKGAGKERGRLKKEKSNRGFVAMISGKKRQGKSPTPSRKWPEGVMGKDGARVWVRE
ncbi:MAG: Serine/threonine-protein kinase 32A [Chrysothrix sp. TS-e1954]|nr:MAG: Serine/threonine-protein kinase 32A [Chrysothrix sp. TS-e1954]